jgi:hypothetical protein
MDEGKPQELPVQFSGDGIRFRGLSGDNPYGFRGTVRDPRAVMRWGVEEAGVIEPERREVQIEFGVADGPPPEEGGPDILQFDMGERDARALRDALTQLLDSAPDHPTWRRRN